VARAAKSRPDVKPSGGGAAPILTIGHSTHPIERFIGLLRAHGVDQLVDIRTIPRSRHNPQFNSEALAKSVEREGIAYAHLKELGGLRHPRADSINTGWRNASFRGYADYMQTEEFEQALDRLLQLCAGKRCAVMCAEAVPWRCHRSLVADALVARGIPVEHVLSGRRRDLHSLTPFARIQKERVTYPKAQGDARREAGAAGQTKLTFDDREETMPAKKRRTKFTAAKEARRRARLAAGTPPSERVIPDKRRKPPKHKKALEELRENPA
jgi:hypothetical protein